MKIINNILPKLTNFEICTYLLDAAIWRPTFDKKLNWKETLEHPNQGFCLESFRDGFVNNPQHSEYLNTFAKIILNRFTEESNFQKWRIERFWWNYYNPTSITNLHQDDHRENYYSIIYNVLASDGGTEIDGVFYPDVLGQGKMFKSSLFHRGTSPVKSFIRLNLNIIFEVL